VMRHAGDTAHGRRLRGLIVVLWRAGLRICEALALAEADLDPRRGSLLVRRGKGGRRREVGMDDWAWEQLEPWLPFRVELPVGPLFCVVNGPTPGARGRRAPPAPSCAASPARPACGDASRRINSACRRRPSSSRCAPTYAAVGHQPRVWSFRFSSGAFGSAGARMRHE
jgi:integrase